MPTRREPDPEEDRLLMRRARQAALVMSLAMVYWVAAQIMGGWLEWPTALIFVIDITTVAALLWALWIVFRIYRARKQQGR